MAHQHATLYINSPLIKSYLYQYIKAQSAHKPERLTKLDHSSNRCILQRKSCHPVDRTTHCSLDAEKHWSVSCQHHVTNNTTRLASKFNQWIHGNTKCIAMMITVSPTQTLKCRCSTASTSVGLYIQYNALQCKSGHFLIKQEKYERFPEDESYISYTWFHVSTVRPDFAL